MSVEERDCPACAGEGLVDCSVCGGGSAGLDAALTCSRCRGRSEREECPACSGTGKVHAAPEPTEGRVALGLHLHGLVDEALRQTPPGASVHARLAALIVADVEEP